MSEAYGFADDALERYARMVRRSLDVPTALVTLVEDDRQVFPGAVGLPSAYQQSRQTPLSHSFCQYVVKDEQPLVVTDARLDNRLADNLAIPDLGVVAYAGWPIVDHTGRTVGSLCAIHPEPHTWRDDELEALADVAAACSTELSERGQREAAQTALLVSEELGERSRVLLATSDRLAASHTLAEIAAGLDEVTRLELGCTLTGLWLRTADLEGRSSRTNPGEWIRAVPFSGQDRAGLDDHQTLEGTGSSPLGDCLAEGRARFFVDRQDLQRRYADLAEDDAPGTAARAYLPLEHAGDAYGALALGWPVPRRFTLAERRTLAAVAAATAQAVKTALLLQDRMHVAETLQRAMLTELPEVPGLQLDARYRPAAERDQVGGDWYDAVHLPTGETSLVIGDVGGHDIGAAASMGQLRSTLRTLDWAEARTPAETVRRLDHAMVDLGTRSVASVLFVRAAPHDAGWSVTWTSAGHPPAVLVSPDGTATVVGGAGDNDLLVGIEPATRRRDHTLQVEPGSTLVLYTDGLVERRGEPLTTGIERLTAAARRHHGRGLPAFLDALIGELVTDQHEDDVAVLAVRFAG